MTPPTIDLIYFDGCPNVQAARANLTAALGREDGDGRWREWNLSDDDTPERFRRYGSPTILVDGDDVRGETGGEAGGNAAVACRADGAPPVAAIRAALTRHG